MVQHATVQHDARRDAPVAVMKIGGGILHGRADVSRLASLLHARTGRRNVLVVSAFSGVTDALLSLLETARLGGDASSGVQALRQRHDDLAQGLPQDLRAFLDSEFAALMHRLQDVAQARRLTDEARAAVASTGEKISCQLVARLLSHEGVVSHALLADEAGIYSDGLYDHATCDLVATRAALAQRLPADAVVVLPGFYGVDAQGRPHLFGRGGSDYSAGCVAACLEADVLEFWKDVPGFLTADPRRVPGARRLTDITFDEARELGFFGAKIVHPRTFEPLRGSGTAVSIRSMTDPESPGTRIAENAPRRGHPVCLSEKTGVALVSLSGGGMVESSGVVGSVFGALKIEGVSVDLISTGVSEVNFSVSQSQAPAALEALQRVQASDPSLFERITVEQGLCSVALVGQDGLSAANLARALTAADAIGIQPLALSCPRSRISLSFIVSAGQSQQCLLALHRAFFESDVAQAVAVPLVS